MPDSFTVGADRPAPAVRAHRPAAPSPAGGDFPVTCRCILGPGAHLARVPLVIPVLIAVIVLVLSGVAVNDAVTVVLAAGAAADQLKRAA